MNVADSEVVASIMEMAGYSLADSIDDADAVLLNTCSIRDNAEQKIIGRLQALRAVRRARPSDRPRLIIGVIGCMAERVREELTGKHGVDVVAGPDSYLDLPALFASAENCVPAVNVELSTTETYRDIVPVRLPGRQVSGFVSIMRGCNNFCSYCIVPYTRGRERSRPVDSILRELADLRSKGYKEVTLLGQNVNSYRDCSGACEVDFAALLALVAEAAPEMRVRFTTSHPKDMSHRTLETIAAHPNICRHIHLPVQSGSNRVLERMNRRYTKEQYLALAEKIRREIPDIAITTDIIVGFPGETMEDVEDTIDVIRRVRYDNAFTFIYSRRTGTPAASMPDQVPEEQVREGFDRVLKVVQDTAREQVARYQGQVAEVLVEEINEHEEGLLTGRMSNNTLVHFPGSPELIGRIVPVALDKCQGFYYMGRIMR